MDKNDSQVGNSPISDLVGALWEDSGYYISWQSNLAMMIFDGIMDYWPDDEKINTHKAARIANERATEFLDRLIEK